jgi:hypothetical protein
MGHRQRRRNRSRSTRDHQREASPSRVQNRSGRLLGPGVLGELIVLGPEVAKTRWIDRRDLRPPKPFGGRSPSRVQGNWASRSHRARRELYRRASRRGRLSRRRGHGDRSGGRRPSNRTPSRSDRRSDLDAPTESRGLAGDLSSSAGDSQPPTWRTSARRLRGLGLCRKRTG